MIWGYESASRSRPPGRRLPPGLPPAERSPFDHRRPPRESAAERGQQSLVAAPESPFLDGDRQRDRKRRGRRVREPADVVDHPARVEPETATDAPDDPRVGPLED